MDYATFLRQAERGEAPPIALLHGGDGQLLDDALAAATRGLFPDRALAVWAARCSMDASAASTRSSGRP